MAYIKNNWVDREGQTRYFETVDDDGALIFTPDYTQVTELGTPVNADNMNHIEEGIEDHENRITVLEEAGDASNFLNKSQITNCLLEVPQKIKLELNNGVLTLKAGSKVIIPNGAGVFEEKTIPTDKIIGITNRTGTNKALVYIQENFNASGTAIITDVTSGDTHTPRAWSIWYDTKNNVVNKYNNDANTVGYTCALPLAEVTLKDGVCLSLDQIFNGMGYIGSTVFVDKGVKGLIPNGRNEDGTLKNIEFTVEKIRTLQCTHTSTQHLRINGTSSQVGDLVYLKDKNWNTKDGEYRDYMVAGSVTANSGVITSLDIKQLFRAADYNDVVKKSGDTMTGTLDIKKPNGQYALNIHTDGMTGENGETFSDFRYLKGNKSFATLRGSYFPSSKKSKFDLFMYDIDAGTYQGGMSLSYDATNGLCFEFPRCTTKATTTSSASNNRVAVVVQNYVNGASWYRVWSDGWIEQGGTIGATTTQKSVSFIKSFSTTNCTVIATDCNYSTTDVSACWPIGIQIRSSSKFDIKAGGTASVRWYACGY